MIGACEFSQRDSQGLVTGTINELYGYTRNGALSTSTNGGLTWSSVSPNTFTQAQADPDRQCQSAEEVPFETVSELDARAITVGSYACKYRLVCVKQINVH